MASLTYGMIMSLDGCSEEKQGNARGSQTLTSHQEHSMPAIDLTWWLRVVGMLYLFMSFVVLVPRIPIRVEGPEGLLERASGGDPTARFALDTWVMFGLYVGAIGMGLLLASGTPEHARALVWTVLCIEFFGGIGIDVYKIARGYKRSAPLTWIAIHVAVIVTGCMSLGG